MVAAMQTAVRYLHDNGVYKHNNQPVVTGSDPQLLCAALRPRVANPEAMKQYQEVALVQQSRDEIGGQLYIHAKEAKRIFGPVPDPGLALDKYIDEVIKTAAAVAEREGLNPLIHQKELLDLAGLDSSRFEI